MGIYRMAMWDRNYGTAKRKPEREGMLLAFQFRMNNMRRSGQAVWCTSPAATVRALPGFQKHLPHYGFHTRCPFALFVMSPLCFCHVRAPAQKPAEYLRSGINASYPLDASLYPPVLKNPTCRHLKALSKRGQQKSLTFRLWPSHVPPSACVSLAGRPNSDLVDPTARTWLPFCRATAKPLPHMSSSFCRGPRTWDI